MKKKFIYRFLSLVIIITVGSFVSCKKYLTETPVATVGTEAAAATGIEMRSMASMRTQQPIVFCADHPFLFLIRDNRSGAILFMGRVADPTK